MCRTVCIPRNDLRRSNFSPLADLDDLHKQEIKPETELPNSCWSTETIAQYALTVPWQRPADILVQDI